MMAPPLDSSNETNNPSINSHTLPSGQNDGYEEEQRSTAESPIGSEKKSSSEFFGRSQELEMLHKAKQQIIVGARQDGIDTASPTPLLPAALVWGVSGTGKSHLIQKFLLQTEQQSACYILQGKYDEYTGSSDPFSALVQALDGLSAQLKDGPVEELERMRKCIKEAFGNDSDDNNDDESSVLSALIKVVPSLSILLDNYYHGGGSSVMVGSTDQSSAPDSASVASSSQRSLQQPTSTNMGVNESVWNQLRYIFLQFVKAISTKERPVYLFLDDLQWSSNVALELLADLVSDNELKHFLLLGSIRQETNPHNDEVLEVDTTSALSACFLSRLQSHNKELTQITTQNLSLVATKHFLASLLGDHSINDHLNVLAQKIHVKTQGNIFFTMQALEELQRKQALVYNQTSCRWEWNSVNVDDISVSDNIIGAIECKLKQLSEDLQDVLSIAAYVRATFDVTTLMHVVQNEQRCSATSPFFTAATTPINEEYLSTLLDKAVLEQLLSNAIGGSKYRFAHDRIQQAAHGMVTHGEERDMLRLRIGHCLLKLCRGTNDYDDDIFTSPAKPSTALSKQTPGHQVHDNSSTEDDHGLMFVAADHLNSVPTKDHMFSVMLNLEVGERAIQMAALASAAGYLERAVKELKLVHNAWEKHYDVSLRLHRARCDVELSLGHFEFGHDLGDQVLKNAKTLDEKLPTYLSMAHGLGRDDKHFQSLELCLSATTSLNNFPKRWYLGHITRDMLKTKSFLKKNDDAAIMRLPLITDQRKLMSMQLLSELAIRASMTRHAMLLLAGVGKLLRNTIRFGLCKDSAFAFVFYGMISKASGDHAMAMRCAGLAKRIISKTNGKSLAGWVSIVISGFIIPFNLPTADVIEECRRGYTLSMEVGEFEIGYLNLQMSIILAFLGGYELQPLIDATESILERSKMYRVQSQGDLVDELLSMLQILAGKKPIDWIQIEESANRDIKSEKLDPSQNTGLIFHFFCRMIIAVYFRKYKLGIKLSDTCRHIAADEKACFLVVLKGLYPGLNAAGRYRETGKRKHLRMLKKMLAEVRHNAKTRGSKFVHHMLMLKAELASIQKQSQKQKSRRVKKAYDAAILVASNASFIQDAALICELAGEHCIREGCSKAETSAYFVKAVGFYEDWGCIAKVDDLKQRRSEYLIGLDENRRVANTEPRNDRVVLFGNNTSSAPAQMDVLPSFAPVPAIGTSVDNSGTKKTFGSQEQSIDEAEDDGDNLSVLTDGS